MPNGHDKNWVRLCGALDGFKVRFGHWPTRVLIYPESLSGLRVNLFTPANFAKIQKKVHLVDADVGFVAEDDSGSSYDYGNEGFPSKRPKPNAAMWLGVKPRIGDSEVEVKVIRPKK